MLRRGAEIRSILSVRRPARVQHLHDLKGSKRQTKAHDNISVVSVLPSFDFDRHTRIVDRTLKIPKSKSEESIFGVVTPAVLARITLDIAERSVLAVFRKRYSTNGRGAAEIQSGCMIVVGERSVMRIVVCAHMSAISHQYTNRLNVILISY